MAGSGYRHVLFLRFGPHSACSVSAASISLSSQVTKPLPAILLLLPLVAHTRGRRDWKAIEVNRPMQCKNNFV